MREVFLIQINNACRHDEANSSITIYSSECDTVFVINARYLTSGIYVSKVSKVKAALKVAKLCVMNMARPRVCITLTLGSNKDLCFFSIKLEKWSAIQHLIQSNHLCKICSLDTSWGLEELYNWI